MGKLTDWNFSDTEANSKLQLVNRQKSALNLTIAELDKEDRTAVFNDPRYRGGLKTSLHECECADFNLIGGYPRKTFTPCMHIYRLAMELGLMRSKYVDRKTQMTTEGRNEVENERLQKIPQGFNTVG